METKITSHKWEVQVIDVLRVKLQEIYAGNSEEIDFGWLYFFYKKGNIELCSPAKGLGCRLHFVLNLRVRSNVNLFMYQM